jgi:1-acyl-sn-glycerol-3-phosphate acyltransferase
VAMYRGNRAMPWFYYVGRIIARALLVLFTRWRVNGKENIPKEGPLLVAANHIAAADPPVLSVSLNRKVIFMAKEELFRSKFTGYFVRNFGAFPVHRGQLDAGALRQANSILAQGLALAMFPEGSRSSNGQLQPALPGSALIATRNGVPILPAGITGTPSIRGLSWLLHRPEITVTFGQPFSLTSAKGSLTKTERTEHADLIMRRIAAVLPESQRGAYRHDS